MKRRALQVIAFLLLGAIVNVAVAWGCAAWSHSTPLSDSLYMSAERAPAWGCFLNSGIGYRKISAWPIRDDDHYSYMIYATRKVEFRPELIDSWSRVASVPIASDKYMHEEACGLPLMTLACQFNEIGVATPAIAVSRLTNSRYLPLAPLWPGFAINTIFYAAVLWVMFVMPFALRRRLRIRRGLCPACAYPMGSSPVCTECGSPIKRSAISGQKSEDVKA